MTQGDQTSARLGEVLLCDKSLGDEVRTDSGNCINMMMIIIPNMMIIIIPKMMIIIIPKMMMIRIDKNRSYSSESPSRCYKHMATF